MAPFTSSESSRPPMALKMAASSCRSLPRKASFTRTAHPSSPSSCAAKKMPPLSKQQIKQNYPNLIALEDAEFSALLLAIQDPQGHRMGRRRMRPDPRRTRRRQHHDHVRLHAHPRDRHPSRQRLLQDTNRRHDLRRVVVLSPHSAQSSDSHSASLCSSRSSMCPLLTATSTHPSSHCIMLIVIVLALLTGIAGALYPAAYAMRIRAVEALRFE